VKSYFPGQRAWMREALFERIYPDTTSRAKSAVLRVLVGTTVNDRISNGKNSVMEWGVIRRRVSQKTAVFQLAHRLNDW